MHRYSTRVDARLATLTEQAALPMQLSGADPTGLQRIKKSLLPKIINRVLPDNDAERMPIQRRLRQAGMYSAVSLGHYFAIKLCLMILFPLLGLGAGLLGVIDIKHGLLAGSLVGCAAFVIPTIWLDLRIAHRHRRLRQALPDFLDLMVVCLESGLSLQGAVQRVSSELAVAHPDLAREMTAVQQEIELGASVDQGLRSFAERSGSEEVRTLSTFVREALRFGTELSDALRMHADSIRMQREQLAEEFAQKAAVKMLAPTLLLIFPVVFVVLVGPAIIQIHQAFTQPGH
jgi:tight adherence protein C